MRSSIMAQLPCRKFSAKEHRVTPMRTVFSLDTSAAGKVKFNKVSQAAKWIKVACAESSLYVKALQRR